MDFSYCATSAPNLITLASTCVLGLFDTKTTILPSVHPSILSNASLVVFHLAMLTFTIGLIYFDSRIYAHFAQEWFVTAWMKDFHFTRPISRLVKPPQQVTF